MMRVAAVALMALAACVPASLQANWCAIPGSAGSPAALGGIVNSYYPGNASVAAGGTTITLGPARGAAQGIAAGDLLLVIQMQDAAISTLNTNAYGNNVAGNPATGYTAIGQSGRYEYVRAGNAVGAAGGTLQLIGGAGGGLTFAYRQAALSNTTARASFQVVKVPQYNNAAVTGALTATPWNGSSGGIVAIDVAGRLTFAGGVVDVVGRGFRGGGARQQTGGAGANTDHRTAASVNTNGAKGEGVAGTPRFVANAGALLDNVVEGYVAGSNGRGAPANGGGGATDGNPAANDQNTGGGGGGNGGAGGLGGHAWCPGAPTGCPQTGGYGGSVVAERGVDRAVMGGGGGAGSNNNNTGAAGAFSSSGAAGGGIVMLRAGEIAGAARILADGADADSTIANDGSGGGGGGGTVFVTALRLAAGGGVTADAAGGDGGSNTGGGAAHGTGGGGGGGFVATSTAAAINVAGGVPGTTANTGTFTASYGATTGAGGNGIAITGAAIPGLSSGGECTPTIVKSFSPALITPGAPTRMSIAVTNNNPTSTLAGLTLTDTYPAGLVNLAAPAPANSCASATTLTSPPGGGSFAVAGGTIGAASSCIYSVGTTATSTGAKTNVIPAGGFNGAYGTFRVATLADASAIVTVSPPLTVLKSSQAYFDPANGATNPKMIPGGFVAYTIEVSNPGGYAVDTDSVVVVDATPARLRLFVGDVPGGAGPVMFQNGAPPSGLTYTYAGLASATDDLDFSNDGGATWTYVPVPNADRVDPAVTHLRIRPRGTMAAGTTFSLLFGYIID